MQFHLVKIGKPAYAEIDSLISHYIKRIKPFTTIEYHEVKAIKGKEKSFASLAKILEIEKGKPKSANYIVALDENGKSFSSVQIAKKILSWQNSSAHKKVFLLVGGPYGHDADILKLANEIWSLSSMVFTSDIAALVLTEQIYRAFNINYGTGYHHE